MAAVLTAQIRATIIWLQTPGAIPWRVSSQTETNNKPCEKAKKSRRSCLFYKKVVSLHYPIIKGL